MTEGWTVDFEVTWEIKIKHPQYFAKGYRKIVGKEQKGFHVEVNKSKLHWACI